MVRRLVLLVTVLVGGVFLACGSSDEETSSSGPSAAETAAQSAPAQTQPPASQPSAPSSTEGPVVEVNLEDPGGSGEYIFDPADFVFEVGQAVTFSFTSETEFHDFAVEEFDIDVPVDAGETVTFTFTFDKAGTYDLICIPHESLGMVGTITVQ